MHLWILAALAANASLLTVIALQINQVGHQLACIANQDNPPASEQYAYTETPYSELPYKVSFAKNDAYSAYRASNTEAIPVRIVGGNLPVTFKDGRIKVLVDSSDPIPVSIKK